MSTNHTYYTMQKAEQARRRRLMWAVAFMLMGLGVGAIIAVLIGQDDDEDMRSMIAQAMEDGYNRGRKATRDALKQLEKEYPNLIDRADEVISSLRN